MAFGDVDWWTHEDTVEYWASAAERMMARSEGRAVIVEVPRLAGVLEKLEWQIGLLTETVRAATPA